MYGEDSSLMQRVGQEHDEGLPRYLDALRARWGLIVTVVVLGVVAALVYSHFTPKRYEAKAELLVNPVQPAAPDPFLGINLLRDLGDPTRSVVTAARYVKTAQTAEFVKRRLHSTRSIDDLLASVKVTPVGQANVVSILGTGRTGKAAAAIANAFAEGTIDQRTSAFQQQLRPLIGRLERRLDDLPPQQRTGGQGIGISDRLAILGPLVGQQDPTLAILSRADIPRAAAWPRPAFSTALALLAALFIGSAIAIAVELSRPRVRKEDELLLQQRLPIFARVPRLRRSEINDFVNGRDSSPAVLSEAFRTLRANLVRSDGRFPASILVTSAMQGDGKTTAVVNLAMAFAASGMRVVVVDGDLRRPMLATIFRVASSDVGFAEVVLGVPTRPLPVVVTRGRGEVRLVSATPQPGDVIDLLEPTRVRRMIERLSENADVVVIDSPPLTEVADALVFAEAAEIVLVAVRLGHARRDRLTQLRQMLVQNRTDAAAFIVTTMKRPRARRGYYQERESRPESGVALP